MLTPITIRYPFGPVHRSLAGNAVRDLFGIAADPPPHTVAENVSLDLTPRDVVLFTGPSGSGKSSLLRAVSEQLNAVDIATLPLPTVPLVDALPGSTADRLDVLAGCGLGEARLMLRTPGELSDGQRYRFRIAAGLTCGAATIAGDEFAAVLDRTTARVLAFTLQKSARRSGVGVLVATTHDDLLDDLNPDVHVHCRGDGQIDVDRRDVKKNSSGSRTTFGSRTAPSPIGRTSLGGITAATSSAASAG